VRWISPALRPGGVTFELVRDGIVIETQLDAEAGDERQPERRHECDGSVTDTFRVLASYSATFPDALDGDAIHISDANGALGVTYIVADGTCPPIDRATYECQVCAPDGPPAFGCLSVSRAGAGGSGAPWGVVVVGVAIMIGRLGRLGRLGRRGRLGPAGRRARTAARPRAARSDRPD
jgi:hypothetical protein